MLKQNHQPNPLTTIASAVGNNVGRPQTTAGQVMVAPQFPGLVQNAAPQYVPRQQAEQQGQQQPQQNPYQQAGMQAPQPSPPQMVPVNNAATIDEIQAACPNAPADFVLQMVQQDATVEQAMAAFIGYQNQQLANQSQGYSGTQVVPQYVPQQSVQPQQPVQQESLPGNEPVAYAAPQPAFGQGDAAAEWSQLVSDRMQLLAQAGVAPDRLRMDAVMQVDREYPGLRQQAMNVPDYSGFKR